MINSKENDTCYPVESNVTNMTLIDTGKPEGIYSPLKTERYFVEEKIQYDAPEEIAIIVPLSKKKPIVVIDTTEKEC